MGKRATFFGFVGTLIACASGCGDDGVSTGQDPVSVRCECPLDAKIENLALCISPTTAFAPAHVYSSHWSSVDSRAVCDPWRDPQPLPSDAWSKIEVSSQCAGTGQFCVGVWSGSSQAPSASDCQLARVCSAIDYAGGNQRLELPAIPSWVAESSECAQRYEREGGYLEFIVQSDQLGCDTTAGSTKLVPLCPVRCQADPKGPGCNICGNGPIVRL
jgi:hypothetical protein